MVSGCDAHSSADLVYAGGALRGRRLPVGWMCAVVALLGLPAAGSAQTVPPWTGPPGAFGSFGLTQTGAPTSELEPYVPCPDGGTACLAAEEQVGALLVAGAPRAGIITRIGLWGVVPGTVHLATVDDAATGYRVRELTPPIAIEPGYNPVPVRLRAEINDKILVTDARIIGYPASDELPGRYLAPPFIAGSVSPWFEDVGRPAGSIFVENDADRDGVPDGADRCDSAPGDAPCPAEVVLVGTVDNESTVLAGRTAVHRFDVAYRPGATVDTATLRLTASAGRIASVPAGCVTVSETVATCTVKDTAVVRPVFARTRGFTIRIATPETGGDVTTTATYENPRFEDAPVPMVTAVAPATATTTAVGAASLRPRVRRFRLARGRLSFEARCPGASVLASCLLDARVTTGSNVLLGSVRKRIGSDASRRISLKLSRSAQRALRRKRRIRAVVRVTRTQIGSQSATTRSTITLRAR